MTPAELSTLLVAASTLLTSIAGLWVAIRSSAKQQATHDLVNGQSNRLESLARSQGVREGVDLGTKLERDRPPS